MTRLEQAIEQADETKDTVWEITRMAGTFFPITAAHALVMMTWAKFCFLEKSRLPCRPDEALLAEFWEWLQEEAL